MSPARVIVLGATGLIGSAIAERLRADGNEVIAVHSRNYSQAKGQAADILINCNGNSFRHKAASNPPWDFDASVVTVERSLFDFEVARYILVSTIDVYPDVSDHDATRESAPINPTRLHPYGFHKWLAERIVERFARVPLVLRVGTAIGPAMTKGPLFDLLHDQPLFMSAESELSFIDTETIAASLSTWVRKPPPQTILNVTGTGAAKLRTVCEKLGVKHRVASGAENIVHRYNINNDALRQVMDVPSSALMAERVLAAALTT